MMTCLGLNTESMLKKLMTCSSQDLTEQRENGYNLAPDQSKLPFARINVDIVELKCRHTSNQ